MSIGATLDLLASPLMHERAARIRDHRPWPAPQRTWVMAQTWTHLLFAHWSVPPSALTAVVPDELALDTFDGRAWVGVTPFCVRNTRPRPTLPVPWLSTFPEINVRTYVSVDGKPGIYFFSLDAASALAVAAARRAYRLPYFRAEMSVAQRAGAVQYASRRVSPQAPPAVFRASYGPTGPVFRASPGTLEHWLTERYCLYTLDDEQRVLRGNIHHPPWPLQHARADIEVNSMTTEIAIDPGGAPLLHYARRQDVVFWSLQPADEDRDQAHSPQA
jgi:uncharacterized protein YqjF (DUF2071 family)